MGRHLSNYKNLLLLSSILLSFQSKSQELPLSSETIQLRDFQLDENKSDNLSSQMGKGKLKQIEVILVELTPGNQTEPHHHLAEELIYIVSGEGYTLIWNKAGGDKIQYNWSQGDMLSPTLNSWHQHVNLSNDKPARYLSLSSTPLTRNLFRDSEYLQSSDYVSEKRWQYSINQEPEYEPIATEGMGVVRMRIGHQIKDLPGRKLQSRRENVLGITVRPEGDMAGNETMEWEVREYLTPDASSPGHRHPWEVVYHIMGGEGYAILQTKDGPRRRVKWKQGDVFFVEADEYHRLIPLENSSPRIWQVKASGYFHNIGNLKIYDIDRDL